jgi:hypothetical protein
MFEAEPDNPEELKALEREWHSGAMETHVESLRLFVRRHRDEILQAAAGSPLGYGWEPALLEVVQRYGSVHPGAELVDQLREMHNEIWYRGETGDYDRKRIQSDWTQRHAESWRRWRHKQYRYVIWRCADRLARDLYVE